MPVASVGEKKTRSCLLWGRGAIRRRGKGPTDSAIICYGSLKKHCSGTKRKLHGGWSFFYMIWSIWSGKIIRYVWFGGQTCCKGSKVYGLGSAWIDLPAMSLASQPHPCYFTWCFLLKRWRLGYCLSRLVRDHSDLAFLKHCRVTVKYLLRVAYVILYLYAYMHIYI